MTTTWDIVRGECSDGVSRYVAGVNCSRCGRFVGRGGLIEVERIDSSYEVAVVGGTCARCVPVEAAERKPRYAKSIGAKP